MSKNEEARGKSSKDLAPKEVSITEQNIKAAKNSQDVLDTAFDTSFIASLSSSEKQDFISLLETFISKSDALEADYRSIKGLLDTLLQLLEPFPQAIWVYEGDTLFYSNEQAGLMDAGFIAHILDQEIKGSAEIAYGEEFFLVQVKAINNRHLITATNITEGKRTERLAAMGQISAHLAHEIRNPIGAISLYASSLLSYAPEHSELIEQMQKAIFRVERIIRATLLFSKGIKPKFAKLSLGSLEARLKTCIKDYTYTKEIAFSMQFESERMIYADIALLEIVLQNFIYNAIDAIEEGTDESGEVYLTYLPCVSSFIIADSGIAIHDVKKLFVPFSTSKLKGNGLGLALCKQIVNAHSGEILLYNDDKKLYKYTLSKEGGEVEGLSLDTLDAKLRDKLRVLGELYTKSFVISLGAAQ